MNKARTETMAHHLLEAFVGRNVRTVRMVLDQFAPQAPTQCGYDGFMWVFADNSKLILQGKELRALP